MAPSREGRETGGVDGLRTGVCGRGTSKEEDVLKKMELVLEPVEVEAEGTIVLGSTVLGSTEGTGGTASIASIRSWVESFGEFGTELIEELDIRKPFKGVGGVVNTPSLFPSLSSRGVVMSFFSGLSISWVRFSACCEGSMTRVAGRDAGELEPETGGSLKSLELLSIPSNPARSNISASCCLFNRSFS